MALKPIHQMTGYVWPAGIPIGQSWSDLFALLYMIQNFQVELFIEIGARHGGLAAMIVNYMEYAGGAYIGIESDRELPDPRLKMRINRRAGHHFIVCDAFSERCEVVLREAIRKADAAYPVLLYCDDGDKVREMHHFAPFLRPGDYLVAHDLGREIFLGDVGDIPGYLIKTGDYLAGADILVMERA